MKKSNSKTLYRFTRDQRSKQNLSSPPEDSFDVRTPTVARVKAAHFRSQSCPFNAELVNNTLGANQRQNSQCSWEGATKLPKQASSQLSGSQIYQSSGTVIIRDCGLEQISSALWRVNKKGLCKKGIGWKGAFAKTQLSQQIRRYELQEELKAIEKQTEEVAIKQRILESLAARCEGVIDNSFEFA